MEQTPPAAVDVGKDALEDIRRNFDVVKNILAPVLPIIIGVTLLDLMLNIYFSDEYGNPSPAYNVFAIFIYFFTAWVSVHYILRWHLYTLKGTAEHNGTWSKPDVKYKKFFFKTLFLQFGLILLMIAPFLLLVILPPAIAFIGIGAAWIYAFYAICRLSFILPATVMGHTPTYREIWVFAQGMAVKTLWAPIRVALKYILLFIVYTFVLFLMLGLIGYSVEGFEQSAIFNFLLGILFVVPCILLGIIWGFIYVGVLSRYYQWGLKNRTDAYGDFK